MLRALPATILMILIALLIYANALNAPFAFDDSMEITENHLIRVTRWTPEAVVRILNSRHNHRPLASLSFAANYSLHGYDVRGYHAVNLAIHIVTALLVFLVARLTLPLAGAESGYIPVLAAALWLVNPVHTQSVTYIVQRMNSLAALFYLLALYGYIRGRMPAAAGGSRGRKLLFYVLCLAAGLLGLAAKQTVATLPVMLFLYEWFFFQNLDRAWLKKQLPWIGLATVVGVVLVFFLLDGSPLKAIAATYAKQKFTPGQRLLTQPLVIVYYVSLLLFPQPSRLALVYDFPLATGLTDPVATVPALLALLALVTGAMYAAGKHRLPAFAVLWFLINLAIESSVVGLALVYEHRTYLPSVFPAIGLAWLVCSRVRPRAAAVSLLCAAIAIGGLWTYRRNTAWQTPVTLWSDNTAKAPKNANARVKLAAAFESMGEDEPARECSEEALRIDPSNPGAHNLLGLLLLKGKQPDKAVPYFRQAVLLAPEDLQYYHNLGVALAESGRSDQAASIFHEVIDHFPYMAQSWYHLARIHARQKDLDKAAEFYAKAIVYQPDYVDAFNDLGIVLLMQGNTPEAIAAFEKAAALDPGYKNAHLNLALILRRQDPRRALNHARRAGMLPPDDPRPHILTGEILTALGEIGQAISYYEKAAALQPDDPVLMYNLACLYARHNDRDRSVERLRQAVDAGYRNWPHLLADKDLENIRDTPYYQSLMKNP